ncbi:MAG: hypothetical protein C5B47_06475 [Verrucomicrobia bacterium]|nr:MAG: hypothetical protein C5B47_06475 [Verrucomicrobiota bacterium]
MRGSNEYSSPTRVLRLKKNSAAHGNFCSRKISVKKQCPDCSNSRKMETHYLIFPAALKLRWPKTDTDLISAQKESAKQVS